MSFAGDTSHGGVALSRSQRTESEDIVSIPAGNATNLILARADPCGGVFYAIESAPPRVYQIGDEFSDAHLAILDTTRAVLILDPNNFMLKAFCVPPTGAMRMYFFGDLWNFWMDELGERMKVTDPMEHLRKARIPGFLDPRSRQLTYEVSVNVQMREAFSEDALSNFRFDGTDHNIALTFDVPSGAFRRAQVIRVDRRSQGTGMSLALRGFPFVWPKFGGASKTPPMQSRVTPPFGTRATPTPPPPLTDPLSDSQRIKLKPREASSPSWNGTGRTTDDDPLTETQRMRLKPRAGSSPSLTPVDGTDPLTETQRMKLRPRERVSDETGGFSSASTDWIDNLISPESEKPAENTPATRSTDSASASPKKGHLTIPIQHLPIPELIERIEAETELEKRWKMIEGNLVLGREERTYALIQRYHDLIDEQVLLWPPARLRMAFGRIPGGIMIGIMQRWRVNQIMAVAEENPEQEKILQYLRERELDRMLTLDTSQELTTAEGARRDLNVDKNADAPAIKKAWRTLLSFLNADHGRQDEKAIHRRKDEIAKHLQVARNILLRQKM